MGTPPEKNFGNLELSQAVNKAVQEMGFEEPTPIQERTIPLALAGKDVIGQAQTGTGKTASFAIPILERPAGKKTLYALVLEPTRELALQVSEEMRSLGRYRKASIVTVYGGASILDQIKALRHGANIVVGTPGRILDHLSRGTLSVSDVSIVVLDEADEMLDMGFIADIEKILGMTSGTRQTMLYSATMPAPIMQIAKRHMREPVKVAINVKDIIAPKIKQVFYEVAEKDKTEVLRRLLEVESPERTLIFCHTKKEVDEVAARLQKLGFNSGALHGDFTQSHREEMMRKFREGAIDILVATDVAGRGIDIEDISHVINYSIPQNPEGYIHRIGRTGRAGRAGIAVTFVTPREYRQLQFIEKIAKTKLNKREIPNAAEVRKARLRLVRESLAELIEAGKQKPYLPVVEELSQSMDLVELSAAALSVAFGSIEVRELAAGRPRSETQGQGRKGMARLFMTLGRKDKIQPGEVLKAVAAESGVPGRSIGKIDIMDSYSFIEVPTELADKVIAAMNRAAIRGRKVSISKAKPREKSQSAARYEKKKRR